MTEPKAGKALRQITGIQKHNLFVFISGEDLWLNQYLYQITAVVVSIHKEVFCLWFENRGPQKITKGIAC